MEQLAEFREPQCCLQQLVEPQLERQQGPFVQLSRRVAPRLDDEHHAEAQSLVGTVGQQFAERKRSLQRRPLSAERRPTARLPPAERLHRCEPPHGSQPQQFAQPERKRIGAGQPPIGQAWAQRDGECRCQLGQVAERGTKLQSDRLLPAAGRRRRGLGVPQDSVQRGPVEEPQRIDAPDLHRTHRAAALPADVVPVQLSLQRPRPQREQYLRLHDRR